jgi:hypothetical protein
MSLASPKGSGRCQKPEAWDPIARHARQLLQRAPGAPGQSARTRSSGYISSFASPKTAQVKFPISHNQTLAVPAAHWPPYPGSGSIPPDLTAALA